MARMKRIHTLTFKRWQELLCADDFVKEGTPPPPPSLEEGVLLCEEIVRLRMMLRGILGHLDAFMPTKEVIDGEFPEIQKVGE